MKNLLYKEFKLSMSPLIILFLVIIFLMTASPNMPISMGLIYVCVFYPIFFLGTNKGKQTNDLYYTSLLPVRRKDIVKARVIVLFLIQLVGILIACLGGILSHYLFGFIAEETEEAVNLGFDYTTIGSFIGFAFIGFSLLDLVFLPLFYRNGRSITLGMILGMIVLAIFFVVFTIVFPATLLSYKSFFTNWIVQVLTLIIGFGISFGIHYLSYYISYKKFELVDF